MNKKYLSYLKNIRSQKESMVATLIEWSNQNSYTENIDGLHRMEALLEKSFAPLDGTVKQIPTAPSVKRDEKGFNKEHPQGASLQIIKRPKAPIQLLLAGHMDTVFPAGSTFQQAKIDGSRLIGPGTADMKGGLLIMLKALEALEESPWAGQIGWEVLITSDEETGSCGTAHLYEEAAKKHHAGLIFEPSYQDGALVSSRKGSLNFIATAKGMAAHAGRNFYDGRNAVTALAEWLLNVERLGDRSKGITVNVGHIQGGGAFNIVPDFASGKVNIRTDTSADALLIGECLQLLIDEANTQKGIFIEIHKQTSRPPKTIDRETELLFSLYRDCAKELNVQLEWRPSGGVCDGNILAAHGLSTLDSLGAIGGGLHTAEEYVEIDSLTERACLTALFLLKLAAGDIALQHFLRSRT